MNTKQKHQTVLAIDPTVRGFGYAVFEGPRNPIDWGTVAIRFNKNYRCKLRAKELIERHKPDVVIMEETKDSLRQDRVRQLITILSQLCKYVGIETVFYHRDDVLTVFGRFGKRTKHEIARTIVEWLPELGNKLPEKRKCYEAEAEEYGIFDAAALALVHMYFND